MKINICMECVAYDSNSTQAYLSTPYQYQPLKNQLSGECYIHCFMLLHASNYLGKIPLVTIISNPT